MKNYNKTFWKQIYTTIWLIIVFMSAGTDLRAATQTDITGPVGSERFGASVLALPNGNIVVTDPLYDSPTATDIGAVYLYNGASRQLISQLTGSTANDQVGIGASGDGDIVVLPSGDFVVASPLWSAARGAVTWCSKTTGCSGAVSVSNSLTGDASGDHIGLVTVLTNGNYVVSSPVWNSSRGGAAFCNGAGGCTGGFSSRITVKGDAANDGVSSHGVTPLTNGSYVVCSGNWNGNRGAATWLNGNGNVVGPVSVANSIVGEFGVDFIGGGAVALANGNFVVSSHEWRGNRGAVTFGNGTTGTAGVVSTANSLIGDTGNDQVGAKVVPLTNGNYVVSSPAWNGNRGAATFGSGSSGVSGSISLANSLVGNNFGDRVGNGLNIIALTNGNYVVGSYLWNGNTGAVTWGDGTTGTVGVITTANSLVGTPATNDYIGFRLDALTNGNYVVRSPNWNSNRGAATWGNGTTGTTGTVSAANSLVGSTPGDYVSLEGTLALTNGNYVVRSVNWSGNRGAVTWGNGTTGTTGVVSSLNSLLGSAPNDYTGLGTQDDVLANGNYVVRTTLNNFRGAVTWGNGAGPISGTVSAANSLVGGTNLDYVGSGFFPIQSFANGNYSVCSVYWDNGALTNAGAITYAARNGSTVGLISSNNSVIGLIAEGGAPPNSKDCRRRSSFDAVNEQLVVGKWAENKVTLFRPTHTAIANGNSSHADTWDYGSFTRTGDVVIPSGRTITLDSDILAVNTVTVANGATLIVSGNRRIAGNVIVHGTLNLSNGKLDMTGGSLTIASDGAITGASASNYIIGKYEQNVTSGGTYVFPVGTADGYSPVTLSNVVGSGNFAVEPHETAYSGTVTGLPATRAPRWWQLTNGGIISADVQFTYAPGDLPAGGESSYRLYRINNGEATEIPSIINAMNRTVTATNVSQFSPWVLANPIGPTAATVSMGGRVTTADGIGIRNAKLTLTDSSGETRTTLSGAFGYYRFRNVSVGETYIISVLSKRFTFDNPTRVLSVTEDLEEINFVASP